MTGIACTKDQLTAGASLSLVSRVTTRERPCWAARAGARPGPARPRTTIQPKLHGLKADDRSPPRFAGCQGAHGSSTASCGEGKGSEEESRLLRGERQSGGADPYLIAGARGDRDARGKLAEGMTRGKQKIDAQRRNAERNQKAKGSQLEARAVGLKVVCPICKVQLANEKQLIDHYGSKHPKEKPPSPSNAE